MKKILIALVTVLSILNNIDANASQIVKPPTLSGTFKYIEKNIPTRVLLWTYPKNNLWDQGKDYKVKIEGNKFNFEFPLIKEPMLFFLVLDVSKNGGGKVSHLGQFYIEPNDQIHVDIFDKQIDSRMGLKDSIVFSGIGSAKYNLIEKLNKDFKDYNNKTPRHKNFDPTDTLKLYLDRFYGTTKKYIQEKQHLIITNNDIDATMKNLLTYQYAPYAVSWADRMQVIFELSKSDGLLRDTIRSHFNSHFNEMIEREPDEAVLLSTEFYSGNSSLFKTKEIINSKDGLADIRRHYNTLISNYSGKVREKMLSELFKGGAGMNNLSNVNSVVYDSLIRQASAYLTSDDGKAIIAEKLTFKRGTGLYNADFIDLNGDSFNTASLKGKVFLLESWGLGCGACAAFHFKFEKELWPILKNYKDFIVLSVYDGKTKENWINGIESKLYTSEDYLNVSNLPFGNSNHEFFKHYKVNYAPFFLLVDGDGEIVANFRPTIDFKDLLALIDSAMGTVKSSK